MQPLTVSTYCDIDICCVKIQMISFECFVIFFPRFFHSKVFLFSFLVVMRTELIHGFN